MLPKGESKNYWKNIRFYLLIILCRHIPIHYKTILRTQLLSKKSSSSFNCPLLYFLLLCLCNILYFCSLLFVISILYQAIFCKRGWQCYTKGISLILFTWGYCTFSGHSLIYFSVFFGKFIGIAQAWGALYITVFSYTRAKAQISQLGNVVQCCNYKQHQHIRFRTQKLVCDRLIKYISWYGASSSSYEGELGLIHQNHEGKWT